MSQHALQSIELSIRISAPRELVFRFFSDPKRYKLWMGEQSTISPGPAGKLTVRFGPGPTAIGTMIEWCEPERIVFDWSHEGRPGGSRVTITFKEEGSATNVTLQHEGIAEQHEREGTASGWRHYLSALGSAALGELLDSIAPGVIETYLSSWSEVDPMRRLKGLSTTVADDVVFRDKFGAIDGCQKLADYIGGVQKMMGPARILPDGSLDRVQAFYRQGWRIDGPGNNPLVRGENLYEFDADCRLRLIVGFWT